MTPEDAAAASADAIGAIASHFMLDPATYAHGAELGFEGMDFYVGGRCGVLGDTTADVVVAAMVFFEPDGIRTSWERTATVMSRHDAAVAFAECGHRWGEANVSDAVDARRLAELAGRVVDAADVALAPVFAGWRALPVPDAPKAAALHHLNGLRELRFAHHAAAVLTSGLTPLEALTVRTPYMVGIFGWADAASDEALAAADARQRWDDAEAATNRRMAAALSVLPEAELDELVGLLAAAHP